MRNGMHKQTGAILSVIDAKPVPRGINASDKGRSPGLQIIALHPPSPTKCPVAQMMQNSLLTVTGSHRSLTCFPFNFGLTYQGLGTACLSVLICR